MEKVNTKFIDYSINEVKKHYIENNKDSSILFGNALINFEEERLINYKNEINAFDKQKIYDKDKLIQIILNCIKEMYTAFKTLTSTLCISNENTKEYTAPIIDISLEEYNKIIYNISILSNEAIKPLGLYCEYYTKPVKKYRIPG